MELPAGMLLLLLGHMLLFAMVCGGCGSARENERKKKMTSGAHASVIGERGCNEVYIFCGILVGNEEL
jgi:hypothetical protein